MMNEIKVPMWQDKPKNSGIIEEGDLVILFENHNSISHVYVAKDKIFQNRFGAFHHNDMIGAEFGTKIKSRHSNGWMYLLSPSPELWSNALHHRTQIVFTLDASAIIYNMQLRPGCIVIESGTGSGSLSTALARTVAPKGHLYTFEFNSIRSNLAIEEFKRNHLDDLVTVECRDVCLQGFGDQLNGKADGVFLDLPSPWLAVPHAHKALKQSGAICSYSPCIEQVQKTCDALRELQFDMIQTIETRLITYDIRKIELADLDFGNDATYPQKEQSMENSKKRALEDENNLENDDSSLKQNNTRVFAKKEGNMRGHTAFLTFAFKYQSDT